MIQRLFSCLLVLGALLCLGLTGCSEDSNRVLSPDEGSSLDGTGLSTGLDGSDDGFNWDEYISQGFYYPEEESTDGGDVDLYNPDEEDGDDGGDTGDVILGRGGN